MVGSASSVAEETKVRPAPQTPAGDPISEAPTQQWYAMPPGAANQYGPATGEEFRAWMQEGRIPAEALVWRQDWPDWKRAGSVFPELATTAPPAPAAASIPTALPTTALPTPTGVAPAPPPGIVQAPIAQAPIAQAAFLPPGATPGMFPTAQASAPVADGFPMMPTEPATTRGTVGRGRPYRPRSNKGPIVAIVVLLLAMIPLSYFVWKVVTEQIVSPPPSQATSSAGNSAPDNAEAEPPPDDSDEAAGSNEPDE